MVATYGISGLSYTPTPTNHRTSTLWARARRSNLPGRRQINLTIGDKYFSPVTIFQKREAGFTVTTFRFDALSPPRIALAAVELQKTTNWCRDFSAFSANAATMSPMNVCAPPACGT